jgi:hypothetical protein
MKLAPPTQAVIDATEALKHLDSLQGPLERAARAAQREVDDLDKRVYGARRTLRQAWTQAFPFRIDATGLGDAGTAKTATLESVRSDIDQDVEWSGNYVIEDSRSTRVLVTYTEAIDRDFARANRAIADLTLAAAMKKRDEALAALGHAHIAHAAARDAFHAAENAVLDIQIAQAANTPEGRALTDTTEALINALYTPKEGK